MSVKIDSNLCDGCGKMSESRCMKVCPGDLFYKNEENKAVLYSGSDCWDCAACVKVCPKSALELFNQSQIGGRGSTLKATPTKKGLLWILKHPDGSEELIDVSGDAVI